MCSPMPMHSKTPWVFDTTGGYQEGTNHKIFECLEFESEIDFETAINNAKHIVKCVNLYEQTTEVLEKIRWYSHDSRDFIIIHDLVKDILSKANEAK
jgi:hypothetical protein